MRKIKSIDTLYNNYLFRSRLEARWAVFLDTLGIRYQYESEGYDLDGVKYLPDFWLPSLQCWLEIKGELRGGPGVSNDWNKPGALAVCSRQPVHLFPNQFSNEPKGYTLSAFEKTEDRTLIHYILLELMDITRSRFYLPEKANGPTQVENDTTFAQALEYILVHWMEKPSSAWTFLFDGTTDGFHGFQVREKDHEDHAQIHITTLFRDKRYPMG